MFTMPPPTAEHSAGIARITSALLAGSNRPSPYPATSSGPAATAEADSSANSSSPAAATAAPTRHLVTSDQPRGSSPPPTVAARANAAGNRVTTRPARAVDTPASASRTGPSTSGQNSSR